MGTSGLCLKSCKCFGVKNARGENLSAKIGGVWAKIAFCGQNANFCGQRKIHHLNLSRLDMILIIRGYKSHVKMNRIKCVVRD